MSSSLVSGKCSCQLLRKPRRTHVPQRISVTEMPRRLKRACGSEEPSKTRRDDAKNSTSRGSGAWHVGVCAMWLTAVTANRQPLHLGDLGKAGVGPKMSVPVGSLNSAGEGKRRADFEGGEPTVLTPIERPRRICLWCGRDLRAVPDAIYCKPTHAQKARRRRARQLQQPLNACSTPLKIAYESRGEALRNAVIYQQFPYDCSCGRYHLTRKRRSGLCEETLVSVAASISPRFLDRSGQRYLHGPIELRVRQREDENEA